MRRNERMSLFRYKFLNATRLRVAIDHINPSKELNSYRTHQSLHLGELRGLFRVLRLLCSLHDARADLAGVHALDAELGVGAKVLHLIGDRNHLNSLLFLLNRHDGGTLVLSGRREVSRRAIAVLRLGVLAREQDQLGLVFLETLLVEL